MNNGIPSIPNPSIQDIADKMGAGAIKQAQGAWMRQHGAKFMPKHLKQPRAAKAPATPKLPPQAALPGKSLAAKIGGTKI